MSSSNKIATVTGAAGFVASMLVEQLLKKGYTVHGTVRSLKDQSKLQSFLDAFSSELASKQLQLFEADLGASGSFSTAIKGSHIVFHTASPFFLGKTSDPQRDFIDPALNGTANVLNSAFAEPSVRKIIVTSSTAAIRDFVPEGQKARFTEKDWNKSATIEKAPYPLSKVLAEKKAWELFEEHKKAGGNKVLLVVNPSWIIGPPVHIRSANDAESLQTLLAKYLDGSYLAAGAPTLRFNIVDVRDVANVQIRLAENDTAEGRYISAHPDSYDGLDWAKVLEKVYPQSTDRLPKKLVEGAPKQGISEVDNSKVLKELEGIKFIPIEQSIKDTVEQLKKFGLINTL